MTFNRRQVTAGLAAFTAAPFASGVRVAAQEGPIRIGLISSLTGFAQIYGEANSTGAAIAAQRINAAGGVNGRKIEIVMRDDKGSPDNTVAAFRELYAEGIRYFLAGPISGSVVAVTPLFKDTDAILVAAGPNNLAITHELYNDNMFRLQLTAIPVFAGLGKVVAEKSPDITKWTAITSDQQANIDLSNIFLNSLKETYAGMGKEIEVEDLVLTKAGAGDFRSQISQIARSGSTGLLNALVGSDSLTFYKQAKSFGLDQRFEVFADVGANLGSMASIASSVPSSIWTPAYWYAQGDKNPVSQEVHKMAVEMTGAKYPFGFIAMAHDAVLSIADGITQAGSEATSEVIAAIETSEPKGAMGPVVFRKADHTYMGEMTFINFGGDASADDGLAVHDVVRIPAEAFMEKATPGIPYKI